MYGGVRDDGVWSLLFEKIVKTICYIVQFIRKVSDSEQTKRAVLRKPELL